eukprot:TRINITY_DN8034_c0_g1_i3.p1 TRINITY_DN8034_c0_g1~~TRINITY_DN8034_c0_g1_i3.p1  ORF type:complete len:246 (+),score=21.42 TRINITY_DN8034_c0_g1_i3:98-739(+)
MYPMFLDSSQLLRNKSQQQQQQMTSLLSVSPIGYSSQEALPYDKHTRQLKGLALGLAQLYNTIICIAQSCPLASIHEKLPATWSPFAWLQVIIEAQLECELQEVLQPNKEKEVGMTSQWIQHLTDMIVKEEESAILVTDDGWDVINTPTIPRPSSPTDVEHWDRAMFVDAQRSQQSTTSSTTTYKSMIDTLGQQGSAFVDRMKRLHDSLKQIQ